ncbi:MAG: DNA polymerase I [Planctomycetota bacterium]|nr:MAG: DNA polymerase I [Planctomycetota bacterium]
MPRLFLLDGTALAFRAHYAMARSGLTAADGSPTGAVYGFTMVLRRILEQEAPERIAVALDPKGPTFRHERYEPYKATRQRAPEEMIAQLDAVRDVVRAHGVPLYEVPGYEADDVLGTLATQGERAGWDVRIVTGDKDFLQLVSERVQLYNVFRPESDAPVIQGPDAAKEKFGVEPARVIEVLGIMGDTSDNVPGVKGIGEMGARQLIEKYRTIAGVLEHLDELTPKLREKIERDREQLLLSRELVTIVCDVPVEPDFAHMPAAAPDTEALRELFRRLAFKSLLVKLDGGAAAARPAATRADRIARTAEDLDVLERELRAAGHCAIDTETTSLFPIDAQLVGISLATQAGHAWYVPFNLEPRLLGGTEALLARLKPLLEDASVRRTGQNYKYDALVFAAHGVRVPEPDFDTMVASYCAAGALRRHNLDALALTFFNEHKIPTSELIGTGKAQITMDKVPVDKVAEYACEDAETTLRLRGVLEAELAEKDATKLYRTRELPLVMVLARMEERGIRLDTELVASIGVELDAEITGLVHGIQELAGFNFNVNSTKALGEVLFEHLKIQEAAGVKKPKRTQTGWSTDAETLETSYADVPIVRKLLEYREVHKLKSTYVEALPTYVSPRTGRVHCSFSQVTAATGRLASSDPNLQNIPIRTERGRKLREAFVPREPDAHGKWVLLSADYSQIELRVMAHLSGDEKMRAAFERGHDIHAATAATIFGIMPELVTREMRSQAKVINFGLLYGMGPQRLARETGLTINEAKKFIEKYFGAFPKVRAWIQHTLEVARERGYVETLSGMKRWMPDIKSENQRVRVNAENAAVNTPVQGSAADIIKKAMIDLDRELATSGLAAQLLLQVHDELVVEVPERELAATQALVVRCMEQAEQLAVPLKVDCGHGANWLAAH